MLVELLKLIFSTNMLLSASFNLQRSKKKYYSLSKPAFCSMQELMKGNLKINFVKILLQLNLGSSKCYFCKIYVKRRSKISF